MSPLSHWLVAWACVLGLAACVGEGPGGEGGERGESGESESGSSEESGSESGSESESETGELPPPDPAEVCELHASGAPVEILSVAEQADANQVVLLPSTEHAYLITLHPDPEGGFVGWANMSIPDWESTQALYSREGTEYQIIRASPGESLSKELVAACPEQGVWRERIYFPHWTDGQIELRSADEDTVWFMYFKEE